MVIKWFKIIMTHSPLDVQIKLIKIKMLPSGIDNYECKYLLKIYIVVPITYLVYS